MKRSILFKLLSLLLALVMLLGALCSCKKDEEEAQTASADVAESDGVVETEDAEINALNILGERDLGGVTVSFYLRAGGNMWDIKSLYADSILSDAVNDAVYERNERLKA